MQQYLDPVVGGTACEAEGGRRAEPDGSRHQRGDGHPQPRRRAPPAAQQRLAGAPASHRNQIKLPGKMKRTKNYAEIGGECRVTCALGSPGLGLGRRRDGALRSGERRRAGSVCRLVRCRCAARRGLWRMFQSRRCHVLVRRHQTKIFVSVCIGFASARADLSVGLDLNLVGCSLLLFLLSYEIRDLNMRLLQ